MLDPMTDEFEDTFHTIDRKNNSILMIYAGKFKRVDKNQKYLKDNGN